LKEIVRSTIQKRDSKGVVRHGAEWLTLWSDPDSLKTDAEKRAEREAGRERIETESRLAAAARSISGNPDFQVQFRDRPAADMPALPALRGEVDSEALIHRFHFPQVHAGLAPADGDERRLFDICEHVRCEALGARLYPGVSENLVAHHIELLSASHLLNAHLASLVTLSEALRMVLRDALLERPEPSIPSAAFRMWDSWIRARFTGQLKGLCAAQRDQTEFGRQALVFIRALLKELGSAEGRKRRFDPKVRPGPSDEAVEDPKDGVNIQRLREDPGGDVFEPGGELFLEGRQAKLAVDANANAGVVPPYRVFTTAHDRVAHAEDLVDSATLHEARVQLERRRADFRRDLSRIVMRLQRRLLARQVRDWSFDLDEGLIDAARLDRVVVNPGFASAYKQERQTEFRDSAVFILIDNSGSMRGKPIEIACIASDLISAALERSGIACEILGFTTRGWKGGDSARDWVRAGRPPNPGRLNDLLHIIYKSAEEPVRRSRTNLCAMLQASLLKENVDGEAILWAARRLMARPEQRKVLIVVSDGAPVDQSTIEHNADKAILDRHLRQVIASIENSGDIELAAVGVKHGVRPYYRKSVEISNVETLGTSLVSVIDKVLSK
jgi:cobaltochelatase CobT